MITLLYHGESVGPVCRRVAQVDDRIRILRDTDVIRPGQFVGQQAVQHPAPIDPLIARWNRARELAEDFIGLQAARNEVVRQGVIDISRAFVELGESFRGPAPVAPPPVAEGPKEVLVRWGSRWVGNADITINTSEAVSLARDKRESRIALTGLCPTTWSTFGVTTFPCVVRPRRHHAGHGFHVCHSRVEVERAINRCGPGWYASVLIDKVAEYRVFVLNGRILRVSERTAPADGGVAWNLAEGGGTRVIRRANWPIDVCKQAIRATRATALDFSAVDLTKDRDDNVWVFETNTAPGLSNDRAIEQIAWGFVWAASNEVPARLDLNRPNLTWQDLRHPSLNRE